MTRRDKIGATLHLDLHTTDSVTKANVEQNNEDTVVRQFIESPEIPPSHHSDPPFHPQQQHTDTHIFVISSNRNMLQRSSKKRRFLHSTFLLKTSTLVLCLQSVSSHFYSVLSHFLVGASIQRKLSPQAAMATKAVKMVKSVNFRQPRVIQVGSSFHNVESLVNGEQYKESEHEIKVSERARKAKNSLDNSYQYKKWQKDPIAEGCEAMREWQEASYLTCNKIHEVDFLSQAWYLGRGGLNAVFKMTDIDGAYVIKILRYKRDYTDRNFDRVRRDSLVMERATSSKYVIDMYTFCGFSQIIEFGKDGGLDYWMEDGYDDLSQDQKLQIATQISQSLTDVHNLDGDGISSITHGDIAAKQYILIDGIFKLNDFNRGRLIHWNDKKEEPCPYTIRSNDGKFRSPEEYKYIPQTAAIDIYTLGSIFVQMITGKEAWYGYETEVAQKAISDGMVPPLEGKKNNSSDPITQVLLKAIEMCYVYEPKDRPKASEVTDFLKGEAKRLSVHWNKLFEGVRRNTSTTAE